MKKINLLLVTLVVSIASVAQYSPQYYREVTIYNNFNTAISNYAGLLILDTKSLISAGYMKADGSDIRFSTRKCNFLLTSYWIEKGINTDSTYIWVRVPSIGANDSALVYMYYGDNNALAGSNFNATFPTRLITSGSAGNISVTTGLKYYGWLEVKAGDTLVLSNNSPIEVVASYIDIQGGINGKGKGSSSTMSESNGSGAGAGGFNASSGSGGAGYGGSGGSGGYDAGETPGAGGSVFGSINGIAAPMGSSGGSGQTLGGAGGGSVSIKGSYIKISGKIIADGANAFMPGANRGGGGGSGGTILIIGDSVNITGHLSVKGGDGSIGPGTVSDDGGGGGGGRIKVFYNSSFNNSSTIDTSGGKAGVYGTFPPQDGSPGTYFDSLYSFKYGKANTQFLYPGGAVYITDSISICQGNSVYLGGDYQDTVGTYIDSFTTAYGCDSIRTTKLIINPVFLTPITKAICQGDSILLGGNYRKIAGVYYDSLQSYTGCDSVVATTLNINPVHLIFKLFSICQGDSIIISHKYRKTAGIFTDSLKTTLGCDSIIANTLVVNPVYNIPQAATICKGDSIFIAGKFRKAAGIYPDNLQTTLGCDSIITTTLTVDSVNTGVTVAANVLTANATGAVYRWLNCADNTHITGETSQSFTATVNGTYSVEVTQNNCTDTSICYQVTGIGVNELLSKNGITVYPNPASKELNLLIQQSTNEKVHVALLNAIGVKVLDINSELSNGRLTIPLNNLAQGIYLLKVEAGEIVAIHNIIIE